MNTLFLKAPQLTAEIMRAHYCEHDLDKILPLFHETLTWIGAGEEQICYDYKMIKDFFIRTYAEKAVPDCIITDEDYRLVSWDEHSCLVAGRCWIATKPETGYVIRAHQRVTFSYKLVDGELKITLIHISNPYADMREGEDFPEQIGRQSYEYLQRLLVEKTRQIALLNSTVSSGLKANWDDEYYSLFYVNEGLCRMLGYTEEELMAKCRGRMTELVYPPDLPQALTDCERCFANSLTYSTEYRMQRKDGKFIWVWDTGSKSKNEEGKTVINSVIVDITERRHTNDTIRRQKAFFQSLYDTTLCALVQYDLNGTFLNANAFTFDVIGYTEEQFRTETGGSLMSIVHPCDVDTVRNTSSASSRIAAPPSITAVSSGGTGLSDGFAPAPTSSTIWMEYPSSKPPIQTSRSFSASSGNATPPMTAFPAASPKSLSGHNFPCLRPTTISSRCSARTEPHTKGRSVPSPRRIAAQS